MTGHTRTATTWPTQVPLGKPFPVREQVLNWGIGDTLLRGYLFAVLSFIFGLFMTLLGLLVLSFPASSALSAVRRLRH